MTFTDNQADWYHYFLRRFGTGKIGSFMARREAMAADARGEIHAEMFGSYVYVPQAQREVSA